ncbi:unnamed protein product [Clonostachys rosea]|uniref:3-hydroxyisobutyrate dehydrogenase n=1 Tax=Bionectria ochroleuca TaxID=29856 RepID=A0ABY6V1P6_BIOOC|nr:unnamed protein product [Clonostachys rosea]
MAAWELKRLGFIGLGTMGLPMAVNLAKKLPGVTLYAYDISREAIEQLQAGANNDRVVACEDASEVASSVVRPTPEPLLDVLITIVPEGAHVRDVYLNEATGVITASLAKKVLIDCSTIDTATSTHVAARLQERDPSVAFYDAPISGGSLGAAKGTLTFMVGSSEDSPHWPLLKHLFEQMGKSIIACGAPTMGLYAKLSNNYCSAMIALATSEAMNLGMRSGMDPRVLARIFGASTAQSTICDKWCPVPGVVPDAPSTHGYQGGFKVQLMQKDLSLALEAAQTVGAKMHLGSAGLDVYAGAARDPNCRDLDSRVVFRYIGGNEEWMKTP